MSGFRNLGRNQQMSCIKLMKDFVYLILTLILYNSSADSAQGCEKPLILLNSLISNTRYKKVKKNIAKNKCYDII